jgi:hypothetical protein
MQMPGTDEFATCQSQSDQASRLSIEVSLFPSHDPGNLLIGIRIGQAHSDSTTMAVRSLATRNR